MNHCKDCKHWGAVPVEEPSGCVQRECVAIPAGDAEDYPESGTAGQPKHLAIIQEAYGSEPTGLFTAPDFGCVLFEAKDPK